MKIPVFLSCPTSLSEPQLEAKEIILNELDYLRLEPRALGQSDYPTDLPLREVLVLATHCSGGVILGFEQFFAKKGIYKRGTASESVAKSARYPTPWNHLEAGILYSLGLPLIVFREDGISGGVFDPGVTDVFVHKMPQSGTGLSDLRDVFLKWQANVRETYYRDRRRPLNNKGRH